MNKPANPSRHAFLLEMEALRSAILEFVRANPECFFIQVKHALNTRFTPRQVAGAMSCMVKAGEIESLGTIKNEKRFRAIAETTETAAAKLAAKKRRNDAAYAKKYGKPTKRDAAPVEVEQSEDKPRKYQGATVDPARPWVTVHREGDTAPATDSRGQGSARSKISVNCFKLF